MGDPSSTYCIGSVRGVHFRMHLFTPRKARPEIEKRIVVLTHTDASLSNLMVSQMIRDETGITLVRGTVRSVRLRHCLKLAKPKRWPLPTMGYIHMRLQFAHDFEGLVFLKLRKHPFVFMDESRSQCRSDAHWVWRRPGEFTYAAMAPTAKFPRINIMFWGDTGVNSR
jgi:hypothetical protein